MGPDLFQDKNIAKPAFPKQKDRKKREKEKKSQNGINKIDRTPNPLEWKKQVFDEFLQLAVN
jgi:ADP-dependent phosphofructokinase/glucokinase